MVKFLIAATFDITCPWCYIGHTRLHRAIAAHQRRPGHEHDTFHIQLIPFYSQPPPPPSAPPFPVPTRSRRELREETYGSLRASLVVQRIQAAAETDGLRLQFDGRTGSSRNGHRLIHQAGKTQGGEAAQRVLDSLFRAYHERGVDITDVDVLARIGVANGMGEREDVEGFLRSGLDGPEVDGLAADAMAGASSGVPFFDVRVDGVVGDERVSGAVETGAWEALFGRLASQSSLCSDR